MNKDISSNLEKLANIKLLSLDVDGVLTDGGIYYNDEGGSFRKFNAKDGMGITLLLNEGVDIAIISAGESGAIETRANRLKIKYVYTNVLKKLSVLQSLIESLHITMSEVAHMGDDVNDIEVFKNVGLAITVADAATPLLSMAQIITESSGGKGAVREICNAIIETRNT